MSLPLLLAKVGLELFRWIDVPLLGLQNFQNDHSQPKGYFQRRQGYCIRTATSWLGVAGFDHREWDELHRIKSGWIFLPDRRGSDDRLFSDLRRFYWRTKQPLVPIDAQVYHHNAGVICIYSKKPHSREKEGTFEVFYRLWYTRTAVCSPSK